jgi:hypothetical protein
MKTRRIWWAGYVARIGEERKLNKFSVGKRKRPLGKLKASMGGWDRNGFREIGWEDGEWVQLAQDKGQLRAVLNAVMHLRVLAPGVGVSYALISQALCI